MSTAVIVVVLRHTACFAYRNSSADLSATQFPMHHSVLVFDFSNYISHFSKLFFPLSPFFFRNDTKEDVFVHQVNSKNCKLKKVI